MNLEEVLSSAKIKPYFIDDGFVLIHGDALKILKKLPDNLFDLIFVDPPYKLSNGGFTVHSGRRAPVNKGDWDASEGFVKDTKFHNKWISECKRLLKDNGTIWISGTYHSIFICGYLLQKNGYKILNDIVWYKPNASPNISCRYFAASHEILIWAKKSTKSKHKFNYQIMKNLNDPDDIFKRNGKQMRSVWSITTPSPKEKIYGKHPTQKPEKLLERIILSSSNEGDLILDPFTGSSTTGIVSYRHNRLFIGIDNNEDYLQLSIKRFLNEKKSKESMLFKK